MIYLLCYNLNILHFPLRKDKAMAEKATEEQAEKKSLFGKTGVIPLVILQFRMLLSLVSDFIPEREKKPAVAKPQQVPGRQIVQPTKSVGLNEFVKDLFSMGYELVDCHHSPYEDDSGRQMTVVRFILAIRDHELAPEFLAKRNQLLGELERYAKEAMWQVQGHMNALFRNYELVSGLYVISLDANSREAFVDGNGKPILRWQKDEGGKRIGTEPVPLTAKKFLRINGNTIGVYNA